MRLARARAASAHAALASLVLLAGCGGVQSALHTAGPHAERVRWLFWGMVLVAAVVYATVIGFLLYAAFHRRRGPAHAPPESHDPPPPAKRRMAIAISAGLAATVVTLLVYLVTDFATSRALAAVPPPNAMRIDVIAHQWWWEVHYVDSIESRRVTTANEIHVPVGRPVMVKATSQDVIHSFWVPNLRGKQDLIPGHQTTFWFQADTPGVYRGQCAEFCGHQHAKMAFFVVAEPPEQFAAWYEQQLRPAPPPADSVQRRGEEVFLSGPCIMCHTVRGTPAAANKAPDLTHIGSRLTIAAGTLPNTRGYLGGWILDPQRVKPGNRMPPNRLSPDDLQALLTYLESLK